MTIHGFRWYAWIFWILFAKFNHLLQLVHIPSIHPVWFLITHPLDQVLQTTPIILRVKDLLYLLLLFLIYLDWWLWHYNLAFQKILSWLLQKRNVKYRVYHCCGGKDNSVCFKLAPSMTSNGPSRLLSNFLEVF